jgi:hypothetical protein
MRFFPAFAVNDLDEGTGMIFAARWRCLTGVALLACAWLAAAPAHAQHAGCPPGMMETGGANAGFGCAPQYDPSAGYAVDTDPTPTWARGPSIDPHAGRIQAATTLFEMEVARHEDLQRRLKTDPEFAKAYRRYTEGVWEQFRQTEHPAPGEHCAAMFARETNIVLMFGPGGEHKGALLVFVGRDVPPPQRPDQISVALTQTGDKAPQRVRAYNYRVPNTELGAVALAVPSIDALLDNMLDKHRFEVTHQDQNIFTIEWRDGLAARDELARCVGRRGHQAPRSN